MLASERQSPECVDEFHDCLPISSTDTPTRHMQCGMKIDMEQYSTHLEQCLVQKEMSPDDFNIDQCPFCDQMVKNLLQHCQTCIIDNDDKNYDLLGATSVPQVI